MTDDEWMRPALDLLIDRVDDAAARQALTDLGAFDLIRKDVESDPAIAVPAGDRGGNLLMALLALRVKFPSEEARAKLETNLSMRRPSPSPDRQPT